jgi:hypothetical protein
VNPSLLYYKPNKSWAPKSDWMTTLPLGEDITGKFIDVSLFFSTYDLE